MCEFKLNYSTTKRLFQIQTHAEKELQRYPEPLQTEDLAIIHTKLKCFGQSIEISSIFVAHYLHFYHEQRNS